MASKIITVVPSDEINEDDGNISRGMLNALLDSGWEIEEEDGPCYRLRRESTVSVAAPRSGAPAVASASDRGLAQMQASFGVGGGVDPGDRMLSALEGMAQVGNASHLGGVIRAAIPGVSMVSSQEIGMAHDMGVQQGMMGKDEHPCPFPRGSEPWQLWMRGYKQALATIDQSADKSYDAYTNEEKLAYTQGKEAATGDDSEVFCLYQGGPLYVAWLKGFVEHGGEVD